jgi:hypothetical protein
MQLAVKPAVKSFSTFFVDDFHGFLQYFSSEVMSALQQRQLSFKIMFNEPFSEGLIEFIFVIALFCLGGASRSCTS